MKITVIDRDDKEHVIEAQSYDTLASVIKKEISPDNFMMCGGCCACATCHVKVDDQYLNLLPTMDEDEDALLDSEDRNKNSRLSCQIQLTDDLDGMTVRIVK